MVIQACECGCDGRLVASSLSGERLESLVWAESATRKLDNRRQRQAMMIIIITTMSNGHSAHRLTRYLFSASPGPRVRSAADGPTLAELADGVHNSRSRAAGRFEVNCVRWSLSTAGRQQVAMNLELWRRSLPRMTASE